MNKKNPFQQIKKHNGQTLIETVVALAVALVVISSIAILVTTALSNATFSKNQNLAALYAQEGLDLARKERNNNIIAFFSTFVQGTYCVGKGQQFNDVIPLTLGQHCSANNRNIDQIFVREITIDKNDPAICGGSGTAQIISSVAWTDSKCNDALNALCHSVALYSCLSNSGILPAP